MKKNSIKLSGTYRTTLFALVSVLALIILLNAILISQTESDRIEAEGQMRLSSIAGRVDNSLYRAESLLNSVSMQIEQIVSADGDREKNLREYFSEERTEYISGNSDGTCFSAYAAYEGELYINGFVPDDNFVLDERSWYVGAKKRMGAVHVTEPYIDASTGEMCYSVSKLLSDGKTVVGLDFNLNNVQKYIEEMNSGGEGTGLIVNGKGMIVGHSNSEYVGRDYKTLDLYSEIVNKVFMFYGDSFVYRADGVKYKIFSDKTNYDWYLIVCVKSNSVSEGLSSHSVYVIGIMILFAVSIVIFFIRTCRSRLAAEKALAVKDEFLKSMSYELKRPLSKIMSRTDTVSASGAAEIGEAAKELNQMLDNLISMSAINNFREKDHKEHKAVKNSMDHRRQIALVTAVLFVTSAFAVGLNTVTQVNWGNTKMQKETELYLYQVKDWVTGNRAVLDVISDSIAAQDNFADNYEKAVVYLDDIVSKYDDISVAYLCNPEWEHTVIMNNGWEPDSSWQVEERQWYIDTLVSEDNFNISAPYLDEQTGLYCTTLSKIVYDSKGNFIGLLGIDYYLDKLIGILGESYTDSGYAFLTDIDGNILNHPYGQYQMKPNFSVNAASLSYRTALAENRAVIIKDYDEVKRVCLSMTEEISGFKVVVMRNVAEIYGNAITSDIIFVCVFVVCIIIVNVIMRRLTLWQQKVNRELKEAAENAINAGKAKNNFLANMSHEIRTPINAVLGMNEMIMRESGEKQIVEYAANIQSAGRTLLSVINDILDFSKIESGRMEIIAVEYDTSSLVNDIVNMVRGRIEKKNLKFIPEIDENIPAMLYGDDVRLRQIIINILTNAVKHTPEGHVRLKMKVLQIRSGFVKLEVSVSDTGIGIKEEDISKLFNSFQRLDQEKNRNIEGTGLGITIVQRLLNMMGSELNVSSVYGVGSTFSFVIEQKIVNSDPMGNYEQRFRICAENQNEENVHTAPEARVLVVDDNETNLIVAKSLLKRTLVKVETAASGMECIEKLEKNIYDIVFLDHMMPEMDGIETLNIIKKEQLAAGTVFVALTANAIHGARQTYIDAGFDDYLSKPFTGRDIEKCLFGHLNRDMVLAGDTDDNSAEKVMDISDVGSALDIEKALAAVDNNQDEYMEIIYDFCDNSRCNDLELDFSMKDYRSYRLNVKIARDAAADAGLTELEADAEQLFNAAKENDGDYIMLHHGEFIKKYRRAAEHIEDIVTAYFS